MSSLFGIEASRPVQFAIAFAIILVLLVLFGLVFRKLTGARLMMPGQDRSRSRQPRLGIVDIYELDRQRQLVLLRRDNVEHLLLIGGLNDVVIETNIVRVAGARLPAASNEASAERFEPNLDQAPRAPQVEPAGRPSIEAQLATQLGAFVRRPSEESDADQELSAIGSVAAPVSAHPEPVLKPDAVSVSSAPSVQGLRAEARGPAFPSAPSAPAPEPVVERPEPRPAFTPPFQSRPTPTAPVPTAPIPAAPVLSPPPAPPVPPPLPEAVRTTAPAPAERPAPAEARAPEAAVLSDMARQLEEALKRPAAPVPGPAAPVVAPAAPVPAGPRVLPEPIRDEDDLLEPSRTEDGPEASFGAPLEDDLTDEPAPPPQAEPPRPAPEAVRPAPAPVPPAPPSPPRAAEAARPAPDAKETDPFSVEDIEAEFARLLGRPLDTSNKG